MRKIMILVATAAVCFPSVAEARHHHRHHHHRHHHVHVSRVPARVNPTQAALQIAFEYWHAYPCGGDFHVVDTTPPANDEAVAAGAQPSMWSSWNGGTPDENNESAPQPFHGCVIGINSNVWTTEYMAAFTAWPEFAVAMIHEVGHLLGHGHSADTADVMYPDTSAKVSVTGMTASGWTE